MTNVKRAGKPMKVLRSASVPRAKTLMKNGTGSKTQNRAKGSGSRKPKVEAKSNIVIAEVVLPEVIVIPAECSFTPEVVVAVRKTRGKAKAKIYKPSKAVKLWFVVAYYEGKSKVLSHGTQLECLAYIAKTAYDTPNLKANVFIAGGVQLLTYEKKVI